MEAPERSKRPGNIYSLLVVKNGFLVAEKYFERVGTME
jgi:hypothetical protein